MPSVMPPSHLWQLPVSLPQPRQHLLHKHVHGVLLRGRGQVQAGAGLSGGITALLAEGEEGDRQQVALAQQRDEFGQLAALGSAAATATACVWQQPNEKRG